MKSRTDQHATLRSASLAGLEKCLPPVTRHVFVNKIKASQKEKGFSHFLPMCFFKTLSLALTFALRD